MCERIIYICKDYHHLIQTLDYLTIKPLSQNALAKYHDNLRVSFLWQNDDLKSPQMTKLELMSSCGPCVVRVTLSRQLSHHMKILDIKRQIRT